MLILRGRLRARGRVGDVFEDDRGGGRCEGGWGKDVENNGEGLGMKRSA